MKHAKRVRDSISESKLRQALKEHLLGNDVGGSNPGQLIIEELGLRHGASRADLVAIGSELHGYEIKSDFDRLHRLSEQVCKYSEIFDRSSLVVGPRHLDSAIGFLPRWWGILLAVRNPFSGKIILVEIRPAQENPSPNVIALSQLLWRSEVLESLEALSAAEGLHDSPRMKLYERLAGVASHSEVHNIVVTSITSRVGWRLP